MSKKKIKIYFDNFWAVKDLKEIGFYSILSKRFDLELDPKPDFMMYSCFGQKKTLKKYDCVRIYYTGENFRPDFSECDYAFSFDYPVSGRNYRLPYYYWYFPNLQNHLQNRGVHESRICNLKFCNFIYSNPYPIKRFEIFHVLNRYKKIDGGGKFLNNLGCMVEDKINFLKNYKFTIAFENSSYPGYTTEKIMEAFAGNTIPIYWGDPLITKIFNPKSFVNCHDFESFEKVLEKVIEIDTNDELFSEYLSQPIFQNNKIPEHVYEEKLLDKFEEIFNRGNQPVRKYSVFTNCKS